jgi:CBS domain-containing protein
MKVKDILSRKGKDVHSVSFNVTVFDALKLMANANVGALPVKNGDKLVGIFSERDYARKVVLMGKLSRNITVSEVMNLNPVTVSEEDEIQQCMRLMTDKYVRHLPVMRYDKLIGIISIGDVVKSIISEQEYIIENLSNYISGR